jgi:hypothetical protein
LSRTCSKQTWFPYTDMCYHVTHASLASVHRCVYLLPSHTKGVNRWSTFWCNPAF